MNKKLLKRIFLAAGCSALALLPFSCTENASGDKTYRTVLFDSDGGSAVPSQTIPDGALIIPPEMPEKTDYDFSGWYKEAEFVNEYDFTSPVKSNLTLYAKWVETGFSVLFDANGGKWSDNTLTKLVVQSGSQFVLPDPNPIKPDTAFIGWYKEKQQDIGAEVTALPSDSVTKDTEFDPNVTTLYALYQKTSPNTVTVYFKLFNGGEVINNTAVHVEKGAAIPQSAIPTGLTREHYTRDGTGWWYDDSHEFTMSNTLTESVVSLANNSGETNHLTLFAKWTGNTYTLTFYKNTTATTDPDDTISRQIVYPALITADDIPAITQAHHTFGGWYLTGACVGTPLAIGDTIAEDTDYYAKWTANTYTVTFHANGGYLGTGTETPLVTTAVYPLTYPTHVTAPSDQGHALLTFYSWNTQPNGTGTAFAASTPVSGDAEYYAVWTLPENRLYYWSESDSGPGASATATITAPGWYTIQLWGAQGGSAGTGDPDDYDYDHDSDTAYNIPGVNWENGQTYSFFVRDVTYSVKGEPADNPTGRMSGGRGAYVLGYVYLYQYDTLQINIGGSGTAGGGFNGGGSGKTNGDSAGGGATDVRINGTALKHRIMVAGGGGGSADARLKDKDATGKKLLLKGGYAGIVGLDDSYTVAGKENGVGDAFGYGAVRNMGGMQSTYNGAGGQAGTWGYGGNGFGDNGATRSGAGGGGWFGGSSGGNNHYNGSGGGGSSYISGVSGFIACNVSSSDEVVPPALGGSFDNRTGGFSPRYASGAQVPDTVRATSWTGYTFDLAEYKAGNEEMPKPSNSSIKEIGHEGPGAAKIAFFSPVNVPIRPAPDSGL